MNDVVENGLYRIKVPYIAHGKVKSRGEMHKIYGLLTEEEQVLKIRLIGVSSVEITNVNWCCDDVVWYMLEDQFLFHHELIETENTQ